VGLIRTLLAISVLITHSEPIFGVRLLNGDMAVTCFYVVSGFLITLILSEKYSDLRAFYVNRALRIYVPYWSAALLSLVIFSIINNPGHSPIVASGLALDANGALLLLWSTISNLTLVGTDLLRYVSVSGDFSIAFPSFMHGGVAGGQGLILVPQSWTLALELQFYVLAPFLARFRVRWLLLLTVALLINRDFLFDLMREKRYPFDDAAVFPMQLQYFLLGALGYHAFRMLRAVKLPERVKLGVGWAAGAAAIVLIFTAEKALHGHDRRDYDVFYIAFAVLVPFVFYLSKGWKFDSKLGEYSYPIYLFHFAINALFFTTSHPDDRMLFGHWQGEMVLLVTAIVCTVYIQVVDKPVQRVRKRIASRSRAEPVPPIAAAAPAD
jgi:peptidoglycan/LPS O-acetylase OafA/YrhL